MSGSLARLAARLGNPGVQALWIAAQRNDLGVRKKDVEAFVRRRGEKQIFAPVQRAEGKTVAEELDTRWMMDLMELQREKGEPPFALAVINVHDRFLRAAPLENKRPETVRDALRVMLRGAERPKLISSDSGNEFKGAVSELLQSQGIAQRFKQPGDVNSLGVVDRAIQTLKQRLAEAAARTDRPWSELLAGAVGAMNRTPRLYGVSAEEVRDDPEVRFLLQQDQAEALAHNNKIAQKRRDRLEEAGGRFRAQVPGSTSRFKRGFQATYGEVQQAANVSGSTVYTADGNRVNIKLVKPVPEETSEAIRREPELKRRRGSQVLDALEKVLGEAALDVTTASTRVREEMGSEKMAESLRTARAGLLELARLDRRFKVQGRKIEKAAGGAAGGAAGSSASAASSSGPAPPEPKVFRRLRPIRDASAPAVAAPPPPAKAFRRLRPLRG